MTDFEVLQQIFPKDIASRIIRFHSHPIADMLHGLINEWKFLKMLSARRLLRFNHYCRNKRMVKHVVAEEMYAMGSVDRKFVEGALTYVPWDVRHPEQCPCQGCARARHDLDIGT